MTNLNTIELKFTIELTKKIQANEIQTLQDAYEFGKNRSCINRMLINQVYTLNQK